MIEYQIKTIASLIKTVFFIKFVSFFSGETGIKDDSSAAKFFCSAFYFIHQCDAIAFSPDAFVCNYS